MKHFLLFVLFLFLCNRLTEAQQTPTFADPPGPEHVLVVYNSQDQTSIDVMTYYRDARNIPEVTNVLGLTELDTLTDITYNGITHTIYLDQQGEIIRDTNNQHSPVPTIHAFKYFNDRIAIPIANYLKTTFVNNTPLADIIRFVVLVKGVPFRIDAREEDSESYGTNVICANLLTHLGETFDDPDALLFYYNKPPGITNKYCNVDPNFSMEHRFIPNHYQAIYDYGGQNRYIPLSYLVTHLSAPGGADSVKRMIDRSVNAINAQNYTWFTNLDPTPCKSVSSGDPEPSFINLGITNYYFEKTEVPITSYDASIMSYCSNGIWTSIGPGCNNMPFSGNYIQTLDFDYADGAFFSSLESHNGLSIGTYPVIRTRDQGLIADFTLMGGTVAVGQAFHSPGSSVIRNDIFFPSYAVGYTFIEAAYLGLEKLDATNVVVGDPLTRIYDCTGTIISQNTTIGSGNYTCDLVVQENATLTISSTSSINFERNAKLIIYGTLVLEDGVTLNFNKYSRLYIEGNLAINGNSAYLNFSDESTLKTNNVSINNSVFMTFNNKSKFYINENGTLITHAGNLFTFKDKSIFYVDGQLIVNTGSALNFQNNSEIRINGEVYFYPGSVINLNNYSTITINGTIKSLGELENMVVFNFPAGSNSTRFRIYDADTILVSYTTLNNGGIDIAIDQPESLKYLSITNSIFEASYNPLKIACKRATLENSMYIANCSFNNCSGTGIGIYLVPEIILENNSINLIGSEFSAVSGIELVNNGAVNIINCKITGSTYGIRSHTSISPQEDTLEYRTDLEADISIRQCEIESLTAILFDVNTDLTPISTLKIKDNQINGFLNGIVINRFRSYIPEIKANTIIGYSTSESVNGIMLTNGNEAYVYHNDILNFLTGINLNIVATPYILENTISASGLSVEPYSGIISVSSNGQIRKNTITYHWNGIEIGSSSPKIGENIITANKSHGIYISDNSNPDLSGSFVGDAKYPLSGYNTIRENGECEILENSELYLKNSLVKLDKGCNTIADDRDDAGNCNYLYLIDGNTIPELIIKARGNYWGNHPVYGNDPTGRFGQSLAIDYSDYFSEPCTYSQGEAELILANSNGEVYDTLYSTGNTAAGLSDIEILYATANNYYYNNQYPQAKQVYEGIIQNYGNDKESIQAYNRLYTIASLTNSSLAEFNQLKDFYLQKASNQTDSLIINTLTHLGNLCLVASEEYLAAINNFDAIAQQHPNTDIALYRQIDALTTSLLIPQDSTLNKGILGKYSVNNLSDYTNKLSELLKTRGKSGIETVKNVLPTEFTLYQNFPNPFNPGTTIKYDIPNTSEVSLIIYDILGKKVKELVNTKQEAGRYEIQFNASNLASGVYIYQLRTPGFTQARKMILAK